MKSIVFVLIVCLTIQSITSSISATDYTLDYMVGRKGMAKMKDAISTVAGPDTMTAEEIQLYDRVTGDSDDDD